MGNDDQFVLLLGGSSGAGKSRTGSELSQRLGVTWLQVDDFRLAFQRSRVALPEHNDALYFFADVLEKPHIWSLPAAELCDALIATGLAMSDAIEAVTANHLTEQYPAVFEGDAILPSIVKRPSLGTWFEQGQLAVVFIVESDEDQLLANIKRRNRGLDLPDAGDVETEARAKWLYGQWVTKEAEALGLPVIEARPWETLVDRVAVAAKIQASD